MDGLIGFMAEAAETLKKLEIADFEARRLWNIAFDGAAAIDSHYTARYKKHGAVSMSQVVDTTQIADTLEWLIIRLAMRGEWQALYKFTVENEQLFIDLRQMRRGAPQWDKYRDLIEGLEIACNL